MDYLVKRSRTKVISADDFPELPAALDPLQSQTRARLQLHLPPWKFLLSLAGVYRKRVLQALVFLLIALTASLLTPNLLHLFVARLSSSAPLFGNLLVGLALAICGVLIGLSNQHYFYRALGVYQQIGNDLNQLIFAKSLRLSMQARAGTPVGDIVNHMSSDVETIADFPQILGDLLWAVVITISVSTMLFFLIGWSAVAPLVVMAMLAPMTRVIAKRFIHFEKSMMAERDQRVTLISQILQSIRVVKYFAWEKAVTAEVEAIRNQELTSRERLARAEVLSGISYIAVSSLVLFVALWVHAWRGFQLDAALLFTCLSLFGLLDEPFGNLSRLFSRLTQALVSTSRLQGFLNQAEKPPISAEAASNDPAVFRLEKATFYHQTPELPVLRDLSLTVLPGEAVAIVGPVGAGKSSFLYSLLGECRQSSGSMRRRLALKSAYVPQEAYIINSTLLENLTFGSSSSGLESLRGILHAACLEKDIQDLPAGLRTEIGEKGVNLSGGQKQRVSLARAALDQPEVILLDDPLSAVDVDTEQKLCDRLLFGRWAKTTRVVVTHRLESLARFDRVVFLLNGRIEAQGKLKEILQLSPSFAEFYSNYEVSEKTLQSHQEREVQEQEPTESRITQDEERATGAVKNSVYKSYILSLGGAGPSRRWILAGLALTAILATGLPLLQKWWLSYYSSHEATWLALTAIGIYGGLGLLVLAGSTLNQMFWLKRGIAAGREIHSRMLRSLLRAPIRFFDSTPVGRILQRFSRDIESVDVYLQWSFEAFVQCVLQVTVSLLLIFFVIPPMLLVIGPILWIYYRLQLDYRRPAREAKRLDSIARSPRYAHFKETLMGLPVIRAFGREEWFLSQFYQKLQFSQRMFYGHYMLNRWFSARIPLLGGAISLATVSAVAVAVQGGFLSAGLGGLVTIYSLSFWAQLNWGIRIFADIESRMTSVERLHFYSSLPPEESDLTRARADLAAWPVKGEIQVKGLRARYASHLPWVLQGVDFHILAGQKAGIVGRTGSGKSTLFQVLYRFLEAEEGVIEIDGVDIRQVPLEQLRRSLAIVPQDPSLFLGTLRSNLDRYSEYTDEQVWQALQQTGLDSFIRALPQGLLTPVQENGCNLSQGQRQLLCLARAILMKAKIMLMDEATASVDVQTDLQIQGVIRHSLQQTTLLIIAHRLGTISGCDQVLEMADGRVVRSMTPDQFDVSMAGPNVPIPTTV